MKNQFPTAGLASPAIVIDEAAMERNLQAMQEKCTVAGVQLWPHIKTHKLVPVLRRQLELGAHGATCAKIGEAEAMLSSGVRRVFIAHSLVGAGQGMRLKALAAQLDELLVAVTSEVHFPALEEMLKTAGLRLPVLLAVNTGLGREGIRSLAEAVALAGRIRSSAWMELAGLYTHEGHAYQVGSPEDAERVAREAHRVLADTSDALGGLSLWPGCSVTASIMAGLPGVRVVRPGSYVFGDLSLAETAGIMPFSNVALTVAATVVDRPANDLALIDAGSKVFSSDKTVRGIFARCVEFPEITVTRLSEEHGFLSGPGVGSLPPGIRLRFIPAHVCPAVNLASCVNVIRDEAVIAIWPVDARGRSD